MATVGIERHAAVVRLARNERWLGLLRDLRIPLASIVEVRAVPDGRRAVRGLRAPGLGGPIRLIGTWRARRNKQYVCVRRGQAALVLLLDGQSYRTVLVGLDDAAEAVDSIRAAQRN